MRRALLLDLRLGIALFGDRRLQPVLLLGDGAVALLHVRQHLVQPQRQQFGTHTALFFPQGLVFLGRGGLPFEVPQLLLHLFPEIVEAFKIFARVADAILGLATAFLVFRYARGLFQVDAQVLGTCLDKARDHALFDDRITARTQPGAEEQVGDVAAPAAHAVEVVQRLAVARDLALHRDLAVLRILPARTAVGIVEHQFNGGRADRLATGRAVENNVGHRLAAQVFGRALAHDPAYRVDDIGLAAAIGSDDTDEITGEQDRGRVDKGFEARQLDFFQTHGGQRYRMPRRGYKTPVVAVG